MSVKTNENYAKLGQNYLFSEIGKRVREYAEANPDKDIIRLGIGDVTLPLAPAVITAMHKATDEMAVKETFRGYPPEYGYDFLREAVSRLYSGMRATIKPDDVFVSDGAKSDTGNIAEIFGDNRVLLPDPVYPVYNDSNVMMGRNITLMKATMENGFLPTPPKDITDSSVIYLCSPNNPTGAVFSYDQLSEWVEYANATGSVIVYDAAYSSYVKGNLPQTIFEIDGAKKCALEIGSFSKSAGFTGTRCSWTVIPEELTVNGTPLATLWKRRQATKFNGVPYVIQRAAEAALSPEGMAQCQEMVDYYMDNAHMLAALFDKKGVWYTGGQNSPYIWIKCPGTDDSWAFFDSLLNDIQIVGTPGCGFGSCGEGFFRFTAFGDNDKTKEAVERLDAYLK